MSKSATLPGAGRGGYATLGGRVAMSRYVRVCPVPLVTFANDPIGVLGRTLSDGIPGLFGGNVNLSCVGTFLDVNHWT
jgi:hypothetical protein